MIVWHSDDAEDVVAYAEPKRSNWPQLRRALLPDEPVTEPTFQLPPQVRDELARLVWLALHDKGARR